jgi:extradiol dioxygenase family protein
MTPFHLAFPVHDLDGARRFYGGLLGCREGRANERWVDFDFFGHQITAHLVAAPLPEPAANEVDGEAVPTRHFGAILAWEQFVALRSRLEAAGVRFRIAPHVRHAGKVGEQTSMFIDDPSGNTLEFKAFRDPAQIFARAPT